MGKTTREEINQDYLFREILGDTDMQTDLVKKLTQICNDKAKGRSRSTLALGVIGDHLIVGMQGAVPIHGETIKAEVVQKCGIQINHIHTANAGTCGRGGSGYHAEMLIVIFCVEKMNLAGTAGLARQPTTKDVSMLGGKLAIGTTKGCCYHCSYYLAKHRIDHTATSRRYSSGQARPKSAPVDGPGMGTWHHPFSGATWKQTPSGIQWEYSKGGTTIYHKDSNQ